VTRPVAGVAAALYFSTARLTTRDAFNQACHVPPLLVSTIAKLGSQRGARGTRGLTVAVMRDRMSTLVMAPACFSTFRWSGATRDGREGYCRPTVTSKLGEADLVASVAIAPVAELLTPVKRAGQ